VRIGTWNLELCPRSTSPRGAAIATWLGSQAADIWLLTEVHRDWDPRGGAFVVSPPRSSGPPEKRWAGIATALSMEQLPPVEESSSSGEEGLCLARLLVGAPGGSVLVACSVLPWKGAGKYWPGLPVGQFAEFAHVLDHHVARIEDERRPGEPIVWGGDFNQPLTPPCTGATKDGAAALREAFDSLGLVALTERAEHLDGTTSAIDHLAVSSELVEGDDVAAVHRPTRDGGQLSDHAAYTAEIGPSRPTR
jgi:Endonuclease/Exonuclease/phosphatase family